MPTPRRVPPAPTAGDAARPSPIGCLAAALLVAGGVPLLSTLTAYTAPIRMLRVGFGVGALPIALAAVVGGVWLARHRRAALTAVPWGRALAAELAALSALALLSAATGSDAPGDWGAGGGVGWAMHVAARQLAGAWGAVLVWLVVGLVATLLTFSGSAAIAAYLDAVASGPADDDLVDDGDVDGPAATGAGRDPSRPPKPPPGAGLQAALPPVPRAPAPAAPATAPPRAAAPPPAPAQPRPAPAAGPPPGTPDRPASRPVKIRGGVAGSSTAASPVVRARDLPPLSLLDETTGVAADADGLRATARTLEATLASLGVPAEVVDIEVGPTVTRFGVVPGYTERGGETRRVPVARIAALKHDLALALAAPTIRIEAPIPGRAMVGIEVPNAQSAAVGLRALLGDKGYRQAAKDHALQVVLGRDVSGAVAMADLARLPHLLVAGSTGSGKSVGLNVLLASLLFRNTPATLRLVLVDPKRVELSRWGRAPHLVAPVVTDPAEVVGALRWLVAEMERRYAALAEVGARDLTSYNRALRPGTPPEPAIVAVLDELADLILQLGAEVEPALVRLAQKARAVGIHLIVATQRPSTDVLTGLIKANFPARIAFAVASATDSRVILDAPGAEALLGRGDMLFLAPDAPQPRRIQGAYLGDDELARLMDFWAAAGWPGPGRLPPWLDLIPGEDPDEDRYQAAVAIAERESGVNASLLQRRLKVPFSTARELMDRLAAEGVVASAGRREGPRPRVFGARTGDDEADGDDDAWMNADT